MTELEHEAGRIAPAAAAFNRHARVVTRILAEADTSLFSILSTETSVWPTSPSGSIYEDTMETKLRLTKQGIKDLNHYGPKPARVVAEATSPVVAEEANASPPSPPVVEKKPDAPVSVGV
jgi:hypothetical protein